MIAIQTARATPVGARRRCCKMTTADETRPLIREGPTVVVQGYSDHAARKPPPDDLKITLKGVVCIFFAAIIVFALAAITSRTILWKDSRASSDSRTIESTTSHLAANAESDDVLSRHGLIKPLNGTHPTLTSTQECTGAGRFANRSLDVYFQWLSRACGRQPCPLLVCVWLPLLPLGRSEIERRCPRRTLTAVVCLEHACIPLSVQATSAAAAAAVDYQYPTSLSLHARTRTVISSWLFIVFRGRFWLPALARL